MTISTSLSKQFCFYENKANSFERKSKFWCFAEKISTLAGGILIASAFLFSTAASTLFPPLSLGSVALLAAGGLSLCWFISPYCNAASERIFQEAILLQGIANSLHQMSSWSSSDLNEFLTSLGIQPQETLQKESFFILIAHFLHTQKVATEALEAFARNLNAAEQYLKDPPQSETKESAFKTTYELRRRAHEAIENVALPSILKCALLFQKISSPEEHTVDLLQHSLLSFEERTHKLFFDQDDSFYHFQNPQKPPITRKELVQYFTENRLSDLQKRLCSYPKEVGDKII